MNIISIKKSGLKHNLYAITKQLLENKLAIGIITSVALFLFLVAYYKNTSAVDWQATYYPATKALLELQSPYVKAPLFFAPPWSLIPIIPFVVPPVLIGGALFFVLSVFGFAYLGYKMGCSPIGIAALLLSAPVLNCIQTGNIEWIPLLGVFMPAPIGLVFLSMKPQSTIGIIIITIINTYRCGGIKELIKILIPSAFLLVLSIIFYGLWFFRMGGAFQAAGSFVLSAWPYAVPVGIYLVFLAAKQNKIDYAIAASPLLSPYAILLTWSGFILSFAKSTRAIVIVSILSWVIWIGYRFWFYQ